MLRGATLNAVGIDVSKGRSTVCALRPFGEVIASPYDVPHTAGDLKKLTDFIKSLSGETRVIMEYTGNYYEPIARTLHDAGIFVAVVHAQLVHDFGNNTIRKRDKSDKKDAVKIANYGLSNWLELPKYTPEAETRQMLKLFSRQYNKYIKQRTILKNNLIALLDITFPGVNKLFTSQPRKNDGHQKWLDFALRFWHCECVRGITLEAFSDSYLLWCKGSGYRFSENKAKAIYSYSQNIVGVLPKNGCTELLITQAITQINAICETIAKVAVEMIRLATSLPEYDTVLSFRGVGEILGPQLMAEIGDVTRFDKKSSLVRYAGLEPGDNSSGQYNPKSVSVSKQGSPHLRKTLFQVMDILLRTAPADDPVFQFLDRKRAEGKHYYSYMTAGRAKLLRMYYARVKEKLSRA